jgi:hypothetical protein
MKKILLLLFGVFLLFPIIIYFGNLTDVPVSREIIVYLRNLVGMSASKTTDNIANADIEKAPESYAQLGLVESWRTMGTSGFSDLLLLTATPASYTTWQAVAGDFLSDPLHSTAFFSSSWGFWQAKRGKLHLVGYYQPWIDVMLLMQITELNGNYQATAIGITEPSSPLTANTPNAMAQQLTARLQRAEQIFRTAMQNPDAIVTMLTPTAVKKSQDSLNQYVTELRKQLADQQTIDRLAVLEWLDAVQAGEIKEVQELAQASSAWIKQLQPIQLLKIDTEHWLLAAINPNQAERVLLVELHIAKHKAQATDVQLWDAATIRGVQ